MVERSTEIVPGMAEAIDARRRERRLSPSEFAAKAGVTPQGLIAVRRGYRRNYQEKLKLGVANALDWPDDVVDRLLAGETEFPTIDRDAGPHLEDIRDTVLDSMTGASVASVKALEARLSERIAALEQRVAEIAGVLPPRLRAVAEGGQVDPDELADALKRGGHKPRSITTEHDEG